MSVHAWRLVGGPLSYGIKDRASGAHVGKVEKYPKDGLFLGTTCLGNSSGFMTKRDECAQATYRLWEKTGRPKLYQATGRDGSPILVSIPED